MGVGVRWVRYEQVQVTQSCCMAAAARRWLAAGLQQGVGRKRAGLKLPQTMRSSQ